MNLYEIIHSDWESHGQVTLAHEKEFEKNEFNEIVAEAHIKAFKKSIEGVSDFELKEYSFYFNIENFWEYVPEILIQEYGFQEIKIKDRFYVSSMARIDGSRPSHDNSERMKLIRKKYKEQC